MENCVIIEVGTSFTRGMVISPNENGSYKIVSIAEGKNSGVKKSEIINKKDTIQSIKTVIKDLSLKSDDKTEIHSVNLIYSGGNLACEQISGMHTLESSSAIVEQSDVNMAQENAKKTQLPEGRFLTEEILLDILLDGQHRVDNPIGSPAQSILTNFMRLHVDKNRVENILNTLDDCALDYENVYVSGLCSALGSTTSKQRKDGVLVINFGGGSTTWAAYVGNLPRAVGGIPIGGDHVTNDIHCAFKIGQIAAEKIKCLQGCATIVENKQDKIEFEHNFTINSISKNALSKVINARMDETLRIILDYISKDNLIEAITEIVICGKGALLTNLDKLTSNIFQRRCTVANPTFPENIIKKGSRTAAYVALLGAAECCTKEAISKEYQKKAQGKFKKILETLFG